MLSLSEFIRFPRKILTAVAVYPKREFSLIYRIRFYFWICIVIAFSACLTYHALGEIGDFVKLSASLYLQVSVSNNILRVLILAYKRKEFFKCLDMLKTPSFISYNEQYRSDFTHLKKICLRIQVTYFILETFSLLGYGLFPVLGSKTLPLEFRHFNSGIFHYPFYIFEIVGTYLVAYAQTGNALHCCGFMMISVFQLRKLNRKLADMRENVRKMPNYSEENSEKLTLEYLRECCIHYNDIQEFSQRLQDCFRVIYFVEMFSGCVSIANASLLLGRMSLFSTEAVALLGYGICMLGELGLHCWFGNFVYDESLEITTSCYFSSWQECGPRVRRTLFILMERAKRPIEVKGLNLITLSLRTFVSILKWTYSYFTLLRDYH